MKNFGIIGAGGYIAQRHLKAIKETGNNLLSAADLKDSVGILDPYFPESEFFLSTDDFFKYINSNKNGKGRTDLVTVCTPNYLYKEHIISALEAGTDLICEKPVVILPSDLDILESAENKTGKRIFTILQLRQHSGILQFREKLNKIKATGKKEVQLTYITGRGKWYNASWKGNIDKSGGIAVNIGIHLFDLLIWLFGSVQNSEVHLSQPNRMSGFLELEDAYVKWFLSIDFNDIPVELKGIKSTFRSITIDGKELEFSEGFTDLHTVVYKNILSGSGAGINEARPSIELVDRIRKQGIVKNKDLFHPYIKNSEAL